MILLWLCIGWVFAATFVAMLPMRYQYVPGMALLIAAPVLIVWIGFGVAWWAAVLPLAAFVSMFRYPLRYFWAKVRGQSPQLPRELGR